jgi:hypothetical protein
MNKIITAQPNQLFLYELLDWSSNPLCDCKIQKKGILRAVQEFDEFPRFGVMDSIIIYLKFNYIIITLHMLFLNFVERFQKLARCSIMHGKDCHYKNYEYFIWCGRQAVTLWFLYLYKQLTIRCRPSYT